MHFAQGKNGIRRGALGSTAVAAAALLALAGCSSSATKTVPLSSGSSIPSGSGAPSSGASSSSGWSVSMSDPSAVLGQWLKDIIGQHYQDACLLSALPAGGVPTSQAQASAAASAAPVAPTTSSCAADFTKPGPMGVSAQGMLSRIRADFVPTTGSTGEITVKVAAVTPTGASATIDGRQITVDGQRLDEIVAAHSTGVTASQINLNFPMSRIGGSWYVANFNLNIG
jgi:hypothetical protein